MRNYRIHILCGILLSWGISQPDIYRSIEDVEKEWTGYTSFQKEEMVSFCDFLFNEGYYERCLLTSFQIIYKFPKDPFVSTIQYYIARCYEEMGNFDLALSYYAKVKGKEQPGSSIYKAVEYRINYIYLIAGELIELLDNIVVASPGIYWSSSESNGSRAWVVNSSDLGVDTYDKDSNAKVRPIRSF